MVAAVGLGELVWSLLILFVMVQYLIVLFTVVVDVFRSQDLSGSGRAVWLVALLIFPLITMIVYLVSRGDGMGMRQLERERNAREATDAYLRSVVLPPPSAGAATELQTAKSLLDSGAVTPDEFERLKARILG